MITVILPRRKHSQTGGKSDSHLKGVFDDADATSFVRWMDELIFHGTK